MGDLLEYQIGYDKATKEMIIFEWASTIDGGFVEIGRFKYNMEIYCDPEDVEQIYIGFLRIYEDGKLIEVKAI